MSRILVVDDEPEIGHILRLALEPRGHTVIVADDGADGLATWQRQRPDLVVLDLILPLMDGFALLEQLRSGDLKADVPVVVLSAITTREARERCLHLGALEFIEKPFDPFEVADVIGTVLASQAPV